jgi:hypothetical protein
VYKYNIDSFHYNHHPNVRRPQQQKGENLIKFSHPFTPSVLNYDDVLGALANLRKTAISFIMSVRISVRMEQLRSLGTNFYENLYLPIFWKHVVKIQVSLKSDKNNGYFTWRPINPFEDISLISSQNVKIFRKKLYTNQNTHFMFKNTLAKIVSFMTLCGK